MKPEPGFHFLPLEFTSKFEDYYVPAELTSADYPNLIPQGQPIETISVPALLAVYNWNKDTHADRYRRCVRFIEYLFDRFDKLRAPPYQPGWKQINLAGTVPGWTRFPPAQEQCSTRSRPSPPASIRRWRGRRLARAAPKSAAEQERLFQQFLEWSKNRKAVMAFGVRAADASRKVASAGESTGEVRAAVRTMPPARQPCCHAARGGSRQRSRAAAQQGALRHFGHRPGSMRCGCIAPLSRGLAAPAQPQQRVAINVTPMTQAEPASNTRLAIQVGPREAIAANSFIRIRGLPPTVALTEGHVIAPGAWAIPLAALPNLSIILPTGLQGQSDIAISLVSVDGAVLAEARTMLCCRRCPPPPRPSPREAQSPPAGAGVVPTLAPAELERALGLHAKGQEQLERGNIYAARKFFERAAEIGLAQSAVALADTYDPEELARLRVIGIQADVEAAKKWYEKARELGAAEASDRLRRLGQR